MNLEELKPLLQEGVVDFQYEKKSGGTCTAKGTLNPDLIPDESKPKEREEGQPVRDFGPNLRYWDVAKEAWRAISADTESVNII